MREPPPPCPGHGPDQPHEVGCALFDGMIHAFVQVIVEDYRQIHDPAGTPVAVTATDEDDVITIQVAIGREAADRMHAEHLAELLDRPGAPWGN